MRPTPFALALTTALALVPPLAAAELPVLLAVDSSRSLSPAESAATVAAARELIARLPAGVPAAVLSFDDQVRWLAVPGDPAAAQALDAIAPSGNFTVLNDGLVEGVRALAGGGVIVLFSDGRDENSATTLEDAARLAGEQRVRVVAVGCGRADERTLRRLALLTGGSFAGPRKSADVDRLTAEVVRLRDGLAAEKRAEEARLTPPTPVPTPVPEPTPAPPPPAKGPGLIFLLLALLLCAAALAIGYLLARRRAAAAPPPRRGEYPDLGTAPGVPMPAPPPTPVVATPPLDPELLADLRARAVAPPGQILEIPLDTAAAFERLPFSEAAEKTLVLTEEMVLTVREPGHEPRSYRLPPDRAISLGRDSQRNTLAFQDPTLSSQHLRVVLDDGVAFLLDLGSTNGVFLNEARVQTARLQPGDRMRAGMLELELQVRQQSLT